MSDNLYVMTSKKIVKITVSILSISVLIILFNLIWIHNSTKRNIYSKTSELPFNKVGIVPGCNKYIANGVLNSYYVQRINAATKLYNLGKINFILVSGDNAHTSYDEPREMRKSLIENGIPNEKIYSDYAGFRTLDTIVRAKEVFLLNDFTFISQNFQNQRGVFIGLHRDINVIAYDADGTGLKKGIKTETREIFAKMKMLLDLYILDKGPKFLGDEIVIGNID